MGEPTTYLKACSMKPGGVARVREMIACHSEFSAIKITVNSERKTYDPFQAERIPIENVLVTFQIPYEGIYMPDFNKEFAKALNQEPTVAVQGERER